MEIAGWDERYRARKNDELQTAPTPLLVKTADQLEPGTALDLACGAGRNSIWLARHGWKVTAVDGSREAIELLSARKGGLEIDARVADLEQHEFRIAPGAWDLIAICFYLQRDLIEPAKQGLKPGGVLVIMVHITEAGEEPTKSRLRPGELIGYFDGWEILHSHEGRAGDTAHHRRTSEIVARRPSVRV